MMIIFDYTFCIILFVMYFESSILYNPVKLTHEMTLGSLESLF